jgi:hypothetical protein
MSKDSCSGSPRTKFIPNKRSSELCLIILIPSKEKS